MSMTPLAAPTATPKPAGTGSGSATGPAGSGSAADGFAALMALFSGATGAATQGEDGDEQGSGTDPAAPETTESSDVAETSETSDTAEAALLAAAGAPWWLTPVPAAPPLDTVGQSGTHQGPSIAGADPVDAVAPAEAGAPTGDTAVGAGPVPPRAPDDASGAASPRVEGLAAAAASGLSAPAAHTEGTQPTAAESVHRQVFPEVVRLATTGPRGNSTQHLTLRLDPGTLGEVRVTLSMRGDSVRVRFATSGSETHAALLQGAPELQRLLEAQAADVRVSVRDGSAPAQPGTPAGATPYSADRAAQEQSGSLDSGAGHGSGHPQTSEGRDATGREPGRQARTPAATHATDGTQDPITRSSPEQPPGSGRHQRLDLSV